MSNYSEQLETEITEKDAQIEALEAERSAMRNQLCILHGYFGWHGEDLPEAGKRLLNETANLLNSYARFNLTQAFTYFYEADTCALLPAGDAGLFPAAHPRPTVPAELAGDYDSFADFASEVERLWCLDECLEYPCQTTLEHALYIMRGLARNDGYDVLLPAYEKFVAVCKDDALLLHADMLLRDYAPVSNRDGMWYGLVRK